jgi:hypothetical protein
MEVLNEVQSVADQLVASGKPIRCEQQATLSLSLSEARQADANHWQLWPS